MYTSIVLPVLLSLFVSTSALPTPHNAGSIAKRIAQQDLVSVAQSWQDLCNQSNGGDKSKDPCNQLAGIRGINALLGGADPCDQQDVADDMIDFAKSGAKNKDALIANAIAFRKHPRNSLVLAGGGKPPSSPFCQKAAKNAEIKNVFNKQLDGVDPDKFGGPNFPVIKFGEKGSCPFGKKANPSNHKCE